MLIIKNFTKATLPYTNGGGMLLSGEYIFTLNETIILQDPLNITFELNAVVGGAGNESFNFGIVFDVIAHKAAVKQQVKLACIETIKSYFNIDKMQFRQPIFTSDLSYILMGVDGVRAVNYVTITQKTDYNSTETDSDMIPTLPVSTFTYSK